MSDTDSVLPPAYIAEASGNLRVAVLEGRFFGDHHAPVADRLARFIAGRGSTVEAVHAWFGDELHSHLRHGRLRHALDRDIAAIDALLGDQVDAVLHADRLQALEGRWRGLAWLVGGIEPGRRVKVRVFTATWGELCRDLERALEFDQSNLFRRIYEEEFGMAGGEPFGLLVIDHAVRHRAAVGATTDDVGTLMQLSAVAAAAFTPIVLGLHPSVLEANSFADLEGVQDITSPLRQAGHARWRALAGRADMRFVTVALPRLLARHPWTDDPTRHDGFRYSEYAPDTASRTWMNAAYAFAACAVRAFANHGWPADVRGAETDRVGGGLITDLPPEPFDSGPPAAWPRTGIEFRLSHRQERALVEAGLMPIGALPYGPDMVFSAVRSMQAPASYTGASAAAAAANARLSSQINSLLCASRFAHHLKVMGRDMVGSFRTPDEIERRLTLWLRAYVNTNIASTGESRARFPLIDASVQVNERPGRPGVFGCVIRLQPHYQLDDVASSFNLVTEFSVPGTR